MKIGIFGASGLSREVLDICIVNGYSDIVFIDRDANNKELSGLKVYGEEDVNSLAIDGFVFIIGVGDNKIRKKIYNTHKTLKYINLIHPTATFGYQQKGQVEKGIGNIVMAGVRMTNSIKIGSFCIFNLNSTIGHDCILEDFTQLAPGVNLSGNVKICEGAYLGTNSSVLQGTANKYITIGSYATVGANAVVTRNVPDEVIVKGVPAK